MLNSVHVLLSYGCPWQCDHCFLHCSPSSGGTFTHAKLHDLLQQAQDTGTVSSVAFEGGEPFMFYPLLRSGLLRARQLGFRTEIVTNSYWSLDPEDAAAWLRPLVEAGLGTLNVSSDEFHQGEDRSGPLAAVQGAESLGLKINVFTIDPPEIAGSGDGGNKGQPIVGGGVRFRGRAAEMLTEGLPVKDWRSFAECPDEDLADPGRVHVDGDGVVQLCQGVAIGNVFQRPLPEIMRDWNPENHPIAGPLLRGGPAELIREHGLDSEPDWPEGFVDACQACYMARKRLRKRFPEHLSPAQAYGEG